MPEPGRARLEGTTLRREAIAISHDGRQLCDACQFVVSAVGLQVERMFYLFTRPREHAPNPPLRRRLEKASFAHGGGTATLGCREGADSISEMLFLAAELHLVLLCRRDHVEAQGRLP